jgi:hypothetical protein
MHIFEAEYRWLFLRAVKEGLENRRRLVFGTVKNGRSRELETMVINHLKQTIHSAVIHLLTIIQI